MKKIYTLSIVTAFCVLLVPTVVGAAVRINEIMYDPPEGDTNHEWIEIENKTTASVDLTGWKFLENNSNHTLVLVQGTAILAANGFAVVADNAEQFQLDYPEYAGTIFDSVFSLSNTGETLALKDATGASIDEATYSIDAGANGDEKSLNRTDLGWKATIASPGSMTPTTEEIGNTDSEIVDTAETTTKKYKPAIHISTADMLLVYDNTVIYKIKVTNEDGKDVDHGQVYWNFGDGESYQSQNTGDIPHTYSYPGHYVVQAAYFEHFYDNVPYLVDRYTVFVHVPNISFRDDGMAVAIKNDNTSELDISGWQIADDTRSQVYVMPTGTIILAGALLIIDKQKMHIPLMEEYRLLYPNNNLVPQTTKSPEVAVVEIVQQGKNDAEYSTIASTIPPTSTFIDPIQNIDPDIASAVEVTYIQPTHETLSENSASEKKSSLKIKALVLLTGVVVLAIVVTMLFVSNTKEKNLSE